MTTGYQVGDRCFATVAQADDYHHSLASPVVSFNTSLGRWEVVQPYWNGSAWVFRYFVRTDDSYDFSLLGYSSIPASSYKACDMTSGVFDGLSLGWLVAGVWIAAWCFVVLRRAIEE